MPAVTQIKYLIFFKNVQANFAHQMAPQIPSLQESLRKAGSLFKIPNLSPDQMTRAQMIQLINALSKLPIKQQYTVGPLIDGLSNLQTFNVQIPFGWMEPNSNERM